jgi:hypothetical protein
MEGRSLHSVSVKSRSDALNTLKKYRDYKEGKGSVVLNSLEKNTIKKPKKNEKGIGMNM